MLEIMPEALLSLRSNLTHLDTLERKCTPLQPCSRRNLC